MMLLIRSRSTGELVRSSGSSAWPAPSSPSGISSSSGWSERPGSHSTNFSPMSDCGRIVHLASARKGAKPGSSISRTAIAFFSGVTSSSLIAPTRAPAIFTSSPSTAPETLSKVARIS